MEKQAEYHTIFITDLQLHVLKPRKPLPWYRVAMKAIRSELAHRAHTTQFYMSPNESQPSTITFPFPQETIAEMERATAQGKKIRFIIPDKGIPIYPGKDMLEYMAAKRNKILKRI